MRYARIYPWRRTRRSRATSNGPDAFFVAQFSAGYTTNMFGFDLRQGQDDLDVLRIARRLPEVKDPVQPPAHQEDDVGLLQPQRARRPALPPMVLPPPALAHPRAQEPHLPP